MQVLQSKLLLEKEITLYLKRDDLLPTIPTGNKFRKLKYNLIKAKKEGIGQLLSFGGAYSNHLYALAAAAKEYEFQAIGIIRGEEHLPLNPTLQFVVDQGMQLHYVDRSIYRQKYDPAFLAQWKEKWGNYYLIPEGGTNTLALKGSGEIITEAQQQIPSTSINYWTVACGTGGTMAGLIHGADGKGQLLGFSVLKGDFLVKEITHLLQQSSSKTYQNWQLIQDYHFGGYAKFKPALISFINAFKQTHQIALDPIYNGKHLYGLFDLIEKDYFPKGSTIVSIHTGGLQGIQGFNQRFGHLIF